MVAVELLALRDDLPLGGPVLWLREVGGRRVLAITIGAREAESIGWALEGIEFPRPMTHDLMATVVADLGATLSEVRITHVDAGTFFADLVLERQGETLRISARPSDAIAVAVRVGATLSADEEVLVEAGIEVEEPEEADLDEGEVVEQFREFLDAVTPEDFGSDR
ncbi:MAG: bifunctional nuclease family protein [Acidimicrobiia bacterium]|nr:bifunctional nuclease family protein [Acidimicrobiia bacterium]